MQKEVVVLGKNQLITLGVIRSLAKAGYSVGLLYVAQKKGDSKVPAASKYVNKTVELVQCSDEAIVDALLREFDYKDTRAVLFPTDDYTALLIDRFRVKLGDKYDIPHIINGSVAEIMDKSCQGQLAKECGVRTPIEWTVSLDTDEISIPDDMVYPCFVKPLVSALSTKNELSKCENFQELKAILGKMQNRLRERSVLIQEFLNVQREYTIGGVCNDQEVFIPAIIRKDIVAQKSRGVTLQGKVVDKNLIAEDLPPIINFLKHIRFVGMFDLEVMVTDHGLYFCELNLRCGGPSYAYFKSGVNLPELAVCAMTHNTFDASRFQLRFDKSFYNNKCAWDDYANGYLNRAAFKTITSECDFSLISDDGDDPVPERRFKRMIILKSLVKRILKKLFK